MEDLSKYLLILMGSVAIGVIVGGTVTIVIDRISNGNWWWDVRRELKEIRKWKT